MTLLIAQTTIITERDGKRFIPEIGSLVDFTDDEIEGLRGQEPPALRRPVNEGQAATVVATPQTRRPAGKPKTVDASGGL